ncbi:PAS domain-containing sensor histidine kinase [Longitalea luteola]|uniref:PAS domain-containing sensor histidine kinase n=1 Tax=Longitalea luteola TaxID=2812563 RepID=UPI001A975D86|nr:PAS domain-containing sensor histidine kinase [Longitalea luteola]
MENNSGKHNDDSCSGNQLIKDDEAKFFLASVIDTMEDSVVTVNLHGIVTSWNKAAERLYGYPAKEIIGRSLLMVTFPNDFSDLLQKIEAIRQGKPIVLYDTYRIHKGGHYIHLEITLSPVKNDKGSVIGVSTVARDVTEFRRTEEALAASESRLRAMVEAAVDFAIITMDEQGVIIDWNSGAEIMFGYMKNEVIGSHTRIIYTKEDQQGLIPELEINMVKTTGRSIDERWHLHKDGSRFFMSGVMTPIHQGDIKGYVKVGRNITDRKLTEEALLLSEQRKSLAMKSAEMGEWEWDGETNLVKLSDQAALLIGLPDHHAQQEPDVLLNYIYPVDKHAVQEQLDAALNGLHIFNTECRIIRPDNRQVKWVNVYGRVLSHTGSQASKMIGVIYDITPRKLLEKQKDDFISLASHELKTPLTAIKTYSELLRENFEEVNEGQNVLLLGKLNSQVDRLVKLIQNLLDSSNFSEGRMKLYLQTFDLNAMVEEQLEALRSIAPDHHLIWKAGPIGLIHADRERIGQVLNNLVSNAVKYSPQQTDIVISTEDKQDKAMLSVKDQGIGVPPEEQQFIFDRYYRGEHGPEAKGFGLGLYISAEIIKQHYGSIGVTSHPGDGSTFYFLLPYS